MQLFVLTKSICRSIQLPDLPEGRYEICHETNNRLIVVIEGKQDGWYVNPVPPSAFRSAQNSPLQANRIVHLLAGADAEDWLLIPTAGDKFSRMFARCPVPDNVSFTVGAAPDNEIITPLPYMGPYHLVLESRTGKWTVRCLEQTIGLYVNGKRTLQAALRPGDVISVLEQRFIVLPGLLAFNSPDGKTKPRTGSRLSLREPEHIDGNNAFTSMPIEDFFHRPPRFSQTIEEQTLTVDSPPAPHEPSQTNAMLTMAPGLLTGVVSLAVATNPLLPLASLAGATIFPFFSRKNAEKQQAIDEEKRVAAYKAYIEDIEGHIADVTAKQEKKLRKYNPPTVQRIAAILKDHHSLWSRNNTQSDYLELRLGTGQIPLKYDITFPQDHFELQSDPMKQLMRELRDRERMLENVPITLPLRKFTHLGISAAEKIRLALAANLLMQLAMDYGYDEMKLCLIGNVPSFNIFSWLPHTWDNSRSNHFIARDAVDMQQLLPILDNMLAGREVEQDKEPPDLENGESEIIIFIFDGEIAQSGVVTRLLFDKRYRGVHVISFAEHSRFLPRRSDAVISIHQDQGRMIWKEEKGSSVLSFCPEASALDLAPQFVSLLANLYLDIPDTSSRIPDSVPFLSLFGVQDVHALNVISRWQRNNASASLAAPIGIDEDGRLCYLNVHERGDGPHGLIAGMTGSGKSEFIMTYILAMAVSFSPEDVSFLLIDYKGGGMAKAFENLPHTAGIITNLDGNAINRSLQAIQSELERRQAIFHEAEQALGVTNLDIIKYQRLHREKRIEKPLPHLLIISDEFAELKTQEPEFMKQLIRASRIGRSLGVHLILATQKPAGIVDDQIWSNTNWRVCLRVQDKRDSQDVIKSPEAALIPMVGRFYIQVGYGMLKMAQSGFTGAPYLPDSPVETGAGVDVLDTVGHVYQHSEIPRGGKKGQTEYQLNAVIKYLCDVAERQNLRAYPICLPPLEKEISLKALRDKYGARQAPYQLEPVVGEVDHPATQSRSLLTLPLSDARNTVVYGGAESGKEKLLQTVLEDLMLSHRPDELNIYILDYADEGLAVYEKAPHVGDVLSSHDDEKLSNLLRTIVRELERRKGLLGSMGALPLHERLQKAGLPNILVVVHHIHVLREKMNDNLNKLQNILLDGPRFGVTFLGTTISPNQLGFKLQEAFSRSLVLQLDQDNDYSMVLGRVGNFRPEAVSGRGIIRQGELCEFQTASGDVPPAQLCEQLQAAYPDEHAPRVRMLPERVSAKQLAADWREDMPYVVPIGMHAANLTTVMLDLHARFIYPVLGTANDISAFMGELLPLLPPVGGNITVWGAEFVGGTPQEGVRYVQLNQSVAFVHELHDEMAAYGAAMKANAPLPEVAEKLILMPAADKIFNQLKGEADGSAYTALISYLEKLKPIYHCHLLMGLPVNELNSMQYDPWFKIQINNSEGIYLGRGFANQHTLVANNSLQLTRNEAAFPFGWLLSGNDADKIKFLSDRNTNEGGI